jgi:cyclophilin family peptidyl-prolyl cis-trans isomerase
MTLHRRLRFESLESRQLMAVDFDMVLDQSVLVGSPIHVPIDVRTDANGPVEVTVLSSDPSVIQAELLTNPKSLRLDVEDYGSMVFRLFPDEAPRPVGRIEELVRSGFYNRTSNQQIIFHRVIDQFVIQAGDPTGTGSGGSSLGLFDDQFDLDLQHNRSGVLSYAKSQDDTNDSQFFITDVPLRHLDYNHSIFGQLIEGETVRKSISQAPVNSANRPLSDIVISEASIFDDQQNGLIRLHARQNIGSATISVTVRNALGESRTRTFVANAESDLFNSGPFLNELIAPAIAPGATIQLQLVSQDVEGDPVRYDSLPVGTLAFQHALDNATGLLTISAPEVNSGTLELLVGVRPLSTSDTRDVYDVQRLKFAIHIPPSASDDMATTTFERPVVVNVLSNDSSVDGSLSPASVQIVTQPSLGTLKVLADGRIEYSHSLATPQSVSFQYRVYSQFGIASRPATVTIQIRSVHQNPVLRHDTNNNQQLDPLDVLELINSINQIGSRQLPLDRLPDQPFLDPNGDGGLNPLDVLEVINAINSRSSGGEGEAREYTQSSLDSPSRIDLVWSHVWEELAMFSREPLHGEDRLRWRKSSSQRSR